MEWEKMPWLQDHQHYNVSLRLLMPMKTHSWITRSLNIWGVWKLIPLFNVLVYEWPPDTKDKHLAHSHHLLLPANSSQFGAIVIIFKFCFGYPCNFKYYVMPQFLFLKTWISWLLIIGVEDVNDTILLSIFPSICTSHCLWAS